MKERYSELANTESSCCGSRKQNTSKIGYSKEEIANLPDDVVGVSAGCGNPTAIAGLKEGQTVLDLGSGGGIDVFISAQAVGATGKAIGVDATPEMVWRARKAARDMNATNVEFRLGEIECMPVESETVDVTISNCVINLSPDKDKVFGEIFRVLKPGGIVAVSDMVTTEDLACDEREMLRTWAGCIGGAISLDEYVKKLTAAGFLDVKVESKYVYTPDEMAKMGSKSSGCGCSAPESKNQAGSEVSSKSSDCGCSAPESKNQAGSEVMSKIATVRVSARKP